MRILELSSSYTANNVLVRKFIIAAWEFLLINFNSITQAYTGKAAKPILETDLIYHPNLIKSKEHPDNV